MTQGEAHEDLLAEITALREHVASQGRRIAEFQGALAQAHEHEAATSEILRVISSSPTDSQPVFEAILRSAVTLCNSLLGNVVRVDGDLVRLVATLHPRPEEVAAIYPAPLTAPLPPCRAIRENTVIHVPDVEAAGAIPPAGLQVTRAAGIRSLLVVPMRRNEQPIGAILIARQAVGPFPDEQIALLQTFADQAVIAIENVRLFTELEEKNKALTTAHAQVTEALDQKTAASEILRVISQSPTDVQPVFDAIAESAVRLCDAEAATVTRFDGEWVHIGAIYGLSAAQNDALRGTFPMRPSGAGGAARAIRDRAIVHIPDVLSDQEYEIQQTAMRSGYRGVLAVPMLHKGHAIGAITLGRAEPGEFSDTQVQLLRIFADQAVIAIENVRLFKELEARNRDLTETLAQQTATGEILRVISSSPTEVQPVFDAIVRSASRLCGGEHAIVTRYDGELLHLAAQHNPRPLAAEETETLFPQRPRRDTSLSARALVDARVVHVPDVEREELAPSVREAYRRMSLQALIAVPMIHEGRPIGVVSVSRGTPGPFSDRQVALLKTFADQAIIAIENVRLFKELEASNREIAEKSRQLEVVSQHKSEFLANMSHELRTPLNAIIGFSEVLTERMFGELNEKQEEYLKDIYASGTHLLSLINDILDLSKIEAGRMELELTDFDLPTALDNALTLVRERAGRRSITLQTSVDERLGEVRADERKIRQVVLNLLSNAIKFTPEGGRIEVAAVPKDGFVEVSISDTGVGIAPEDQEAVFEEFRQVGTADKKAEGTGLGLTLCRKFIELHGGRIGVKSQVGAGSTFTFTIPVGRRD